jgi:hypothetical protein
MFMAQPLRLLRGVCQHPLAIGGKRQVHAGRNCFADNCEPLDLPADRFHRTVGAKEAVGQRLILAQDAQQHVLGIDIRRAELTRLVPREEDHTARLLGVLVKHFSGAPLLDFKSR